MIMAQLQENLAGLDGYFPAPYSVDPIPDTLRHGLIAPAFMGILSAISTFALITFILWRLASWRKHYRTFIGYNQYVMLVLNLLIADLQQSTAFLISWYWISKNAILAPTSACFAQGWLLHSGDVSSALFVLAIAVHTFLTAVMGRQINNSVFYSSIAMLWVLAYVLTGIGVAMHPDDYFVRAGAWCWVSSKYEHERLALHYVWIFFTEFASIVVYSITFVVLRCKTRRLFKNYRENPDCANPKTVRAVNRITLMMTLYPCVYILLTLPLSAGRMWSMAHGSAPTSDAFSCTAGALLASCGWADALLYTLTRKRLLNETMPGRSSRNERGQITATRTITVDDETTGCPGSEMTIRDFMDAQNRREVDPDERPSGYLSSNDDGDALMASGSKATKRLGIEVDGRPRVQDFEPGRVRSPPITIPAVLPKRTRLEPWEVGRDCRGPII